MRPELGKLLASQPFRRPARARRSSLWPVAVAVGQVISMSFAKRAAKSGQLNAPRKKPRECREAKL